MMAGQDFLYVSACSRQTARNGPFRTVRRRFVTGGPVVRTRPGLQPGACSVQALAGSGSSLLVFAAAHRGEPRPRENPVRGWCELWCISPVLAKVRGSGARSLAAPTSGDPDHLVRQASPPSSRRTR